MGICIHPVGLVFFGCVLSAYVVFIRLAKKWPAVVRIWTRTEIPFTKPPYEIPKRNLSRRVQLAALAIIGLSLGEFAVLSCGYTSFYSLLGEHALYQVSAILSYTRRIQMCANITTVPSFNNYMQTNYDYVFQLLPYSPIIAVLILASNFYVKLLNIFLRIYILVNQRSVHFCVELHGSVHHDD